MKQQFTLTGSMVEHIKLIPNDTQLGEVLAALWHHKIDGHELTCNNPANGYIINLLKSDIAKADNTRERQRKSRDNGVTVTLMSQPPSAPSPQERESPPHTPSIEKEQSPLPILPKCVRVSERDIENLFDSWYQLYPRKMSRSDAYKAFKQVISNQHTDVNEFVSKLRKSVIANIKGNPDWNRDNGRFIPYPATWLRGEKWNDDFLIKTGESIKASQVANDADKILSGLIKR